MARIEIVKGTKFGRWTVLREGDPVPTTRGDAMRSIRCICDCGTEKDVLLQSLRKGRSNSCGCLKLEKHKGPKPDRCHNLAGRKFGRLLAIRLQDHWTGPTKWLCRCDCGVEKAVLASHLVRGNSKSCGCQIGVGIAERNRSNAKHGMWRSKEFALWTGMLARCNNPKHDQYHRYGARGIKVCKEWSDSFLAFYNYMGNRPTNKHSIDRIDNNKGYEPGNVRWATPIEQCNNKTNNVWIEAEGKRWTISQYARHKGLSPSCVKLRLKRGVTGDDLGAPSMRGARS